VKKKKSADINPVFSVLLQFIIGDWNMKTVEKVIERTASQSLYPFCARSDPNWLDFKNVS
jgi:hypothetical protein